jgi:hypothetical protein
MSRGQLWIAASTAANTVVKSCAEGAPGDSFRKGGGLADAPGRRLGGMKAKSPLRASYLRGLTHRAARSTPIIPARSRTRAAPQAERALLSGGLQTSPPRRVGSTALVRKYRVRGTVGALRIGSSSSPVPVPKHHGEGHGNELGPRPTGRLRPVVCRPGTAGRRAQAARRRTSPAAARPSYPASKLASVAHPDCVDR